MMIVEVISNMAVLFLIGMVLAAVFGLGPRKKGDGS